ncbi:serine aminopeptidase domain-containing protein [Novipirellula artificiosorum]|uniref:Alpha/beta hydrolase family protein n=1 Tax=Novipirellula artificiosorum TaxID=2528016 RepID=A0A5C6D755_9BACT|nr:alpha/beta hydrolase [Novipirellula artificiosorum]TWU31521.1 Alpha/beta hydrolase family protein [Novipirellula artificiosorum]
MTEQAIVMGRHDHLLGIWCCPEKTLDSTTAVIFVTPGVLHHAGPFRLHVDLARGLASDGIASLRFDLSGIGESFGIGTAGRSIDRAADELGQAIDWLSRNHGITKIILFGLCSGADDAIHTANQDPRIVGVVAMDGCGYATAKHFWHRIKDHYLRRLLRPTIWLRFLSRPFRKTTECPKSLGPGTDIREFPSRDIAATQLRALADQGTQLHFVYTGGVSDYYNHAGQFADMFPELADAPGVSTHFYPEIDHVAFLCEDRERLGEHVRQQIQAMVNCRIHEGATDATSTRFPQSI